MSSGTANRPPAVAPVSGISLIIDNGDGKQETLEFQKSRTRVVNIGRKSGHAKETYVVEDDKALFRCPVVSRKHAKITFTEYGNVYITDLGSHHGTHLLKPGDAVSRMVTPEVPNFLSDGDVITFGKTVGKEQSLVRPVSVRLKLQHVADPSSISSPDDAVHEVTIISDSSDDAPPKTSTGRYGVFLPSSEQTSSSSDSESDMEMSPPPPDTLKRPVCASSRVLANYLELSQALRGSRVAPMISPPLSPQRSWADEDPEAEMDLEDGNSDIDAPPLASPPPSHIPESSNLIGDLVTPWPHVPFFPSLYNYPFPRVHVADAGTSRNMNYPTPGSYRPSGGPMNVQMPNPPMLDSFEASRILHGHAPFPGEVSNYITNVLAAPGPSSIPATQDPSSHQREEEQPHSQLISAPHVAPAEIPGASEPSQNYDAPSVPSPTPDRAMDRSLIELVRVHAQSQRAKSTPDIVPEVNGRATDLDLTVLDETNDQGQQLSIIAASEEICTEIETPEQEAHEDGTVEDLRKQAMEDITNEVAAIKSARAEVDQLVVQLKAQMQAVCSVPTSAGTTDADFVQTSTSSPLKRKRDEVEDLDEPAPALPSTSELRGANVPTGIPEAASPSPKRRKTMKVLSAVAQTTAIAAIGAVAAWSALAFA